MNVKNLQIQAESDVVAARCAGREMARDVGFGSADQTRLATAISELVRNVIQHAGSGTCTFVDESDGDAGRIRVVVEDEGPGIPDSEGAGEVRSGESRGLGAGLPGTRRLVSEFCLESEPGHTRVTIVMVRRLEGGLSAGDPSETS
jgi:serine/threonine-protein kinase RsbT